MRNEGPALFFGTLTIVVGCIVLVQLAGRRQYKCHDRLNALFRFRPSAPPTGLMWRAAD